MASITSSGIGSNLDVESLVTQLMTLEKKPLTVLQTRQSSFQAQLSAYGQLKSIVSAFGDAATRLADPKQTAAYKASVSDNSLFTATIGSGAVPGNYAVEVQHLAQVQKLAAAGQASTSAAIGTGAATTVTLSFGSITGGSLDNNTGKYTGATFTANAARTPVTINLGSTNNSLSGIRDAINAANAGVTATIINDGSGTPYRLALTSNSTGAVNSLKIDVSGDPAIASLLAYNPAGTQNLMQNQAGKDAALVIDGLAIASATNTISGALPGVTLNLSKDNLGQTTTLAIALDDSNLRSTLDNFVSAYNSANTMLRNATAYDATTKQGALLQGDSATVSTQRNLRNTVSQNFSGLTGGFASLSDIGVSIQVDGSLLVNTAKFNAAVSSSREGVVALVSAVATASKAAADRVVGTNGVLASRTDGLNASIKDNTRQQDDLQARLVTIEKHYRAQFTALDTTMSSMTSTSNYLTQQFASLAKNNQ